MAPPPLDPVHSAACLSQAVKCRCVYGAARAGVRALQLQQYTDDTLSL